MCDGIFGSGRTFAQAQNKVRTDKNAVIGFAAAVEKGILYGISLAVSPEKPLTFRFRVL